MLNKDQSIKWEEATIQAFVGIKEALKNAPVLADPDYNKDFQMFSFSSEISIASVVL